MVCVVATIAMTVSALFYPATSGAYDGAGSVFRRSSDTNKIALTFDDGPHPKYTEEILDLLREHGVKATFFVIGSNMEMFGKYAARAVREGHEIGNHTATHPHIKDMTYSDIVEELSRADDAVYSKTGKRTKLFRPPEGKCSPELQRACKDAGYSIILWSIDTVDWSGNPSENIVREVLENLRGGDIILFHDYVSRQNTTIDALRILIPKLKEMGYEFVTVSELIESDVCESGTE